MLDRIKSNKFLIITLLLIFFLGLGVRLGLICMTPGASPYWGMWAGVQEAARNLVEGHGCVTGQAGQFTPYTALPPGSVGLLAGTYWAFGEYNDIYLRVIQAIIDSFGCLLMFLIGRELFSRRIGLIAAFLYAIYLPIAYLSTWPLHDALMPFITLISLYFFVKAVRTRAIKFYILSGLFAGVGCYFQPTTVLLPLMFGLGLFIYSLRKINFKECILNVAKVTAVMMAVLVLVVSPWMVRNYHVTGALILMRPTLWQGIWEGFGEFENPVGAVLSDEHATNLAKEALGEDVKPWSPETEAYFRGEVLNTIKEYPGWWLSVLAKRVPRTIVNFSELGINAHPLLSEDSRVLLAHLYRDAPAIGYKEAIGGLMTGMKDGTFWEMIRSHPYGLLYFGLVGFFAAVPPLLSVVAIWAMRRNWRPLILVATVPVYFSAVHIFTFVASYKSIVPASLGYIIFSAIALHYIYDRIMRSRGKTDELATPPNR